MQTKTRDDIDVSEISFYRDHLSKSIHVSKLVESTFDKIAPSWPVKNLISVNPLKGLEHLHFNDALRLGESYFQSNHHLNGKEIVNRETIKWCAAFFDEGQATIRMPFTNLGLYQSVRQLIAHDSILKNIEMDKKKYVNTLPSDPEILIVDLLNRLELNVSEQEAYLLSLLTTLPGWSSYIRYKAKWSSTTILAQQDLQTDYLALRILLDYLFGSNEIHLHRYPQKSQSDIESIIRAENEYRYTLLTKINRENRSCSSQNVAAQLIACIDVRSEPLRYALEKQGDYETFGFAGFFGLPVTIKNELDGSSYDSCPVLISPKYEVCEVVSSSYQQKNALLQRKRYIGTGKRIYQMLKYMFTTPFSLAEIVGPFSGIWMLFKTLLPMTAAKCKSKILDFNIDVPITPILDNLSLRDKSMYAESFLKLIGLTQHFAPLIILCGHVGDTENNAHHTALNCGACGAHSGAPNARILASILNDADIRNHLTTCNLHIPKETVFIPALHNTTTGDVSFLPVDNTFPDKLTRLKQDFIKAKQALAIETALSSNQHKDRSSNWAEQRPEWGLARNASFIVGPRWLTKGIPLGGRAFLHSYDWRIDHDGSLLTTILTAPMVVAQWINAQYLFSTIDNIAYGSGSKITQNITGKIGVMQGNQSDLMHGLPLQSVYIDDQNAYHEPVRLLTVIHAPRLTITNVITSQTILHTLLKNEWVHFCCHDPHDGQIYQLTNDLTWMPYDFQYQNTASN